MDLVIRGARVVDGTGGPSFTADVGIHEGRIAEVGRIAGGGRRTLDARGLATRLRKFEVRPADHRFPEGIRKGYLREDLHDAWNRYLPPVAPTEDRGGTWLLSIAQSESESPSLSEAGGGQQGQQGQPPGPEVFEHEDLWSDYLDEDGAA